MLLPVEVAAIRRVYPGFDPHPAKELESVILGFNTIFFFGWLLIVWRLYKAYGWEIYKQFGADLLLRNRVILQHIFMTLLKLDVFFYLGFGGLLPFFVFRTQLTLFCQKMSKSFFLLPGTKIHQIRPPYSKTSSSRYR